MATDRDFHFALDGKLIGILDRNDGQCHLDEFGYYTHEMYRDYPSISHINSVAQNNSIVVVFAVNPRYKNIYSEMSKFIPGSSVSILEKDGKNIVHLISKKFEEITTTVRVQADDDKPSNIGIKFYSRCKSRKSRLTNECNNIELGHQVEFTAEILLKGTTKTRFVPLTLNIFLCNTGISERHKTNRNYKNFRSLSICREHEDIEFVLRLT